MRELIEELDGHLTEVKTAKLPNALRRYAVVNKDTGKHVANVEAATFSAVSQDWVPKNLGTGKWLVFQPPKMIDGSPQSGTWWRPILSSVRSEGKGWRTLQSRADPGDTKFAPKGYRKSDLKTG